MGMYLFIKMYVSLSISIPLTAPHVTPHVTPHAHVTAHVTAHKCMNTTQTHPHHSHTHTTCMNTHIPVQQAELHYRYRFYPPGGYSNYVAVTVTGLIAQERLKEKHYIYSYRFDRPGEAIRTTLQLQLQVLSPRNKNCND